MDAEQETDIASTEPTCKALVDGKSCGKPAHYRAGVPTSGGAATIEVCDEHTPGIITSIVRDEQ